MSQDGVTFASSSAPTVVDAKLQLPTTGTSASSFDCEPDAELQLPTWWYGPKLILFYATMPWSRKPQLPSPLCPFRESYCRSGNAADCAQRRACEPDYFCWYCTHYDPNAALPSSPVTDERLRLFHQHPDEKCNSETLALCARRRARRRGIYDDELGFDFDHVPDYSCEYCTFYDDHIYTYNVIDSRVGVDVITLEQRHAQAALDILQKARDERLDEIKRALKKQFSALQKARDERLDEKERALKSWVAQRRTLFELLHKTLTSLSPPPAGDTDMSAILSKDQYGDKDWRAEILADDSIGNYWHFRARERKAAGDAEIPIANKYRGRWRFSGWSFEKPAFERWL